MKKYSVLEKLYSSFSSESFAIAVLEEYIICIVVTGISIFWEIPGDQDDDVAPVEIACVKMGGDNMAGGAGGKCVRDSLDDTRQGNAADSAEENHAEGDGETDGQ